MKNLEGTVRAAIDRYHMIEEGDRIAVGVSGGKDSLYLLDSLISISRYYPKHFTVTALTADPCFGGTPTDFSSVQNFCRTRNIPYIIKRTRIGTIVFEKQQEENPCSLCARMRRGILHNLCREEGLNKLALGHHLDDAVQTFFMNLFYGGKLGCFSPVTYLSRKSIHMIRPLIFCEERDIQRTVQKRCFPVVKSLCPADGVTARKEIELRICELEKDFPDIRAKTVGAIQRGTLDGW